MSDPLALDEQLLSLLDESARSSTYKPALLPALFDRVQASTSDRPCARPRAHARLRTKRPVSGGARPSPDTAKGRHRQVSSRRLFLTTFRLTISSRPPSTSASVVLRLAARKTTEERQPALTWTALQARVQTSPARATAPSSAICEPRRGPRWLLVCRVLVSGFAVHRPAAAHACWTCVISAGVGGRTRPG
jgi:hypothetical protein